MRRSRYLALSALVAALVLLSSFLPAQLSEWNDRSLLDVPHIQRAEEAEGLAESISLTVPEKLLLMQAGDLTTMEITSPEAEELPPVLWQTQEAGGANAAAGEAALVLAELEAQWQTRLQEVQEELLILQRMGGIPALWPADAAVELTERRQTLYVDQDIQRSFLVNDMTLSCPPYAVELAVDDESGKILSATVRLGVGAAPAWGAAGAAGFGGAWRDYWGMDSVGNTWGRYLEELLEGIALRQNSGEHTYSAEVIFTYEGESLRMLLLGRSTGGREHTFQWIHG